MTITKNLPQLVAAIVEQASKATLVTHDALLQLRDDLEGYQHKGNTLTPNRKQGGGGRKVYIAKEEGFEWTAELKARLVNYFSPQRLEVMVKALEQNPALEPLNKDDKQQALLTTLADVLTTQYPFAKTLQNNTNALHYAIVKATEEGLLAESSAGQLHSPKLNNEGIQDSDGRAYKDTAQPLLKRLALAKSAVTQRETTGTPVEALFDTRRANKIHKLTREKATIEQAVLTLLSEKPLTSEEIFARLSAKTPEGNYRYNHPALPALRRALAQVLKQGSSFPKIDSAVQPNINREKSRIQREASQYIGLASHPLTLEEALVRLEVKEDRFNYLYDADDLSKLRQQLKTAERNLQEAYHQGLSELKAIQPALSLETSPVAKTTVNSLFSHSGNEGLASQLDLLTVADFTQVLLEGLSGRLSPREKTVLVKRYGLEGDKPQELKEIGILIGATAERVRQIEAKVLSKARNYLRSAERDQKPEERYRSLNALGNTLNELG
jgi:hypothetical protein